MASQTHAPRRVHICGCSGSGKSTLGKTLAERLNVPFTEIDALYHGPDWSECSREELADKVAQCIAADGWVIDGNYGHVRPLIWQKADTVIFLDYSYALVWTRIVRRTLRRMILREVLWNGNRENALRTFFSRDSIIWWMMTTWQKRHRDAIAAETSQELAGKTILRFRHPKQTEQWLSKRWEL